MGLRIQTNVAAMNAHKNLGISDAQMAKSLERLSSGYRINRAADDAAGLAIAGKLRTNVKSFVKAAENTAQSNAMMQVGEGAMDQIENITNRLKELATQASSANTDTTGRSRLNDEFTALKNEINRIAQATKYGGDQLLTGTFGATVTSALTGANLTANAGIAGTSAFDVSGHVGPGTKYTLTDANDMGISLSNGIVTQVVTLAATGAQTINFSALGVKITVDSGYNDDGELASGAGAAFTVSNATQNVQVSSVNQSYAQIALSFSNMQSTSSYGAGNALSNWGVSTVSAAQSALDSIDSAITFITQKRGDVGALMNRLGYAAANLATTIENTSAAESTIRDVDMAAEMTSFTKNQILLQAGTAMLAQANMAPQQILALFG